MPRVRRLTAKCKCLTKRNDFSRFFAPTQHGVATEGGAVLSRMRVISISFLIYTPSGDEASGAEVLAHHLQLLYWSHILNG